MWVNGALPKAERFGVNFDRLIDHVAVLRGLLVVPWDAEFREAVPDLAKREQGGETRYIVFRNLAEDDRECSFGTVYFHIDNSWYFEVVKADRQYEEKVNMTRRERAKIAP
uniref:Uncharacterized protein n=1 Tax=Caenorhabditis japonica TaxID=281687 RepID=A0A8R1IR36_CAEJA